MPFYITESELKPLPCVFGNQALHLNQNSEEKYLSTYFQKDTFATSPGLIVAVSYLLKS